MVYPMSSQTFLSESYIHQKLSQGNIFVSQGTSSQNKGMLTNILCVGSFIFPGTHTHTQVIPIAQWWPSPGLASHHPVLPGWRSLKVLVRWWCSFFLKLLKPSHRNEHLKSVNNLFTQQIQSSSWGTKHPSSLPWEFGRIWHFEVQSYHVLYLMNVFFF